MKEVSQQQQQQTPTKPRRVIRRRHRQPVDPDVEVDPILLNKIVQESSLPSAYSFEIPKTIARIHKVKAKHVALQMPEGLLMYATVLADILKRLVVLSHKPETNREDSNTTKKDPEDPSETRSLQVSILGDVTYGACCVDDLGAAALGASLLVHYGHSCLVPLQHTAIPCLYVFVEIQIDVPHLVSCLDVTLQKKPSTHIYLLGTVQFRHALVLVKDSLQSLGYENISIPQAKPLSPGEVLGCTSPQLTEHDTPNAVVCFVADGRFHLEATLISNPHITKFYRYDPYGKVLSEEAYQHDKMKSIRHNAIQIVAAKGKTFGIVLGTLGRQGNPAIVQRIQNILKRHNKRFFLMLLSEITPTKLRLFADTIDAWVQVACPRLSVDWGHFLAEKPVLTPYELMVCMGETEWREVYPMDYYSYAGGPWTNYFDRNKDRALCCEDDKNCCKQQG